MVNIMDKSDYLLMLLREAADFSQIKKEFSWSDSATINILRRLIERNLIIKKKAGLYQTTKQGIDFLLEKLKKEKAEKNESVNDRLFYITGVLLKKKDAENKKLQLIKSFGLGGLGESFTEIKQIYNEAVLGDHINIDFIQEMWSIHTEKVCNLHGFDFNKAYEKNAQTIRCFVDPNDLFKQLHFISLSPLEQFKRNFYPHNETEEQFKRKNKISL